MNNKDFLVNKVQSLDPIKLSGQDPKYLLRLLQRVGTVSASELLTFEPAAGYVYKDDLQAVNGVAELPDDFDYSQPVFLVYEEGFEGSPLPTSLRRIQGKNLVFSQKSTRTYALKYRRDISTCFDTLDAEFPFRSSKAMELICSEIQALVYKATDDWRENPGARNALADSNRVE